MKEQEGNAYCDQDRRKSQHQDYSQNYRESACQYANEGEKFDQEAYQYDGNLLALR